MSIILCEHKIFSVYSALETQVVIFFITIFLSFTCIFLYQLSWQALLITESNKLVGQYSYNVWKFKINNLLLKEDLLDFVEAGTTIALGQKSNMPREIIKL